MAAKLGWQPKKWLEKKSKKGVSSYPTGTDAFYGPDDRRASKVAVGIVGPEPSISAEIPGEPLRHAWPYPSSSDRAGQTSQRNRDQTAHRGSGLQAARTGKRVQAVAGQFVRRDVLADDVGRRCLGEQVANEAVQLVPGAGDMPGSMEHRR